MLARIKTTYASHRTVDEGYNSKDNLNIYQLRAQNLVPTTTLATFQSWVNKAIADRTWLILVYHKVASSQLAGYDTFTVDFASQMSWLKTTGVTVKTWADALTEVVPQGPRQ